MLGPSHEHRAAATVGKGYILPTVITTLRRLLVLLAIVIVLAIVVALVLARRLPRLVVGRLAVAARRHGPKMAGERRTRQRCAAAP
jgi:hypothetical protein